eukprot:TCONS_00052483-protein
MTSLMRVVGSSVAIAKEAGNVIRKTLLSGKLDIVDKAETAKEFDPQTEADRSAQKMIIGSLSHLYPDLLIIGEEEGCDSIEENEVVKEIDHEVIGKTCPESLKDLQIKDLIVWVDPLDATREFTEGSVENVTVLIGISAHGKAIAGVIHQPFYEQDVGRTFWGVVGLGAFGINTTKPEDPNRFHLITSKSHWSDSLKETFASFKDATVLKAGGSGYKVMQVIEGNADVYLYPQRGTKKWDSCGPEAILRSVGGVVTDGLGDEIDYAAVEKRFHVNWRGLVASLGKDHQKVIEQIPLKTKEALQADYDVKTKL